MMKYRVRLLNRRYSSDVKTWLRENLEPINYLMYDDNTGGLMLYIGQVDFENEEDWLLFRLHFDGAYRDDLNFAAYEHDGKNFIRDTGFF